MDNKNIPLLRKQFIFLLNFAVDTMKKDYIESDDLVLFSNEVKKFNSWIDTLDLPEDLHNKFKNVSFDYSSKRKDVSDVSFLFLKRTVLNWVQQKDRISLLNSFLTRYDKNLELL